MCIQLTSDSETGSVLTNYLAGKFTESNLPKGPRGATINKERVAEVQPLLGLMRDIGSAHGGKTPGQVIHLSSKKCVSWFLPDLQYCPRSCNRAYRPAAVSPQQCQTKCLSILKE